ncbi:hypothetical protein [uncultured Sphingomonas sp.]|uniref:hypothetical protein n=1 Tax=uncultured Sphingomonas sp. TaxID=158754 RepID=UPI0025E826C4|nr:hypothetical protein [uncultured Sphingomonas sp.]
MTWYQSGSVTVTQGSATITGAGTDFMAPNVFPGDGFVDEAGYTYEVVGAQSSTQLTISPAYRGASGSGRGYKIMPLQDYQRLLAQRAADLIGSFSAVRDGVGQGMFPDGTVAAPGVRFAGDQDTGLRRPGANSMSIVVGGVDGLIVSATGARLDAPTGNGRLQFYPAVNSAGNRLLSVNAAGSAAAPIEVSGADVNITNSANAVVACFKENGNVGLGINAPAYKLDVAAGGATSSEIDVARFYAATAGAATARILFGSSANDLSAAIGGQTFTGADGGLLFYTKKSGTLREVARVDNDGNLLVGVTGGTCHDLSKATAEQTPIVMVRSSQTGLRSAMIYACSGGDTWAGSGAAMYLNRNSQTGRSLNAGGTINASGADYAEYVRKSLACGTILKGDVCGIDSNGELTRTWADARRYVVKSTDPNLVGGDTWAAHLGPRPEAPLYAAPAYDGPAEPTKPVEPAAFVPPVIEMPVQPVRGDGEDDEAYLLRLAAFLNNRDATIAQAQAAAAAQIEAAKAQAACAAAVEQYQADLAAYRDAQAAYRSAVEAAEAAHAVALTAHGEALTVWEAELEAARQTVDRIAFSGQVPVNVDADTLAACEAALGDGVAVYLVAVARGAGIGVAAVREADMTMPLYMRRLGAVWAIRDGRPWIDVQHG